MSHPDPNQQRVGTYGVPGMPYMHHHYNAHARYGAMPDGSLLAGGAPTGAPLPGYIVPEAQDMAAAQNFAAQNALAAQGLAPIPGQAGGPTYMNYEPSSSEQAATSLSLAQHQVRMNEMLAASRAQLQDKQPQAAAAQAKPSKAAGERKRPARKSVSPQEAWDSKFKELETFYEEFGHSDVPQTYKPNKALGKWVGKQREHYKNLKVGKASPLTEERQSRLLSVDFKFQIGKGQHAKIHGIFITEDLMETWETRYKDLIEFKEKFGHVDVPVKYDANKALGRWVALQRRKFRELETNKISSSSVLDTRIQKLQDLGFKFIIGRGDYIRSSSLDGGIHNQVELWEDRFKKLEAYKEEFGNVDVPQAYTDKKLAQWVTKQREQHKLRMQGKSSSLTDERMARLAALGFHFRAYAALWEERLEELKKYRDEKGHTYVKSSENTQLYIWVARQRQTFRDFLEGQKSPMDHDRIRKLEELDFDWKYDGGTKRRSEKKLKLIASAKKSPMPKPPIIDASTLIPDITALFPSTFKSEHESILALGGDKKEVGEGTVEQKLDGDDELLGAVDDAGIGVIETEDKESILPGEQGANGVIALVDQEVDVIQAAGASETTTNSEVVAASETIANSEAAAGSETAATNQAAAASEAGTAGQAAAASEACTTGQAVAASEAGITGQAAAASEAGTTGQAAAASDSAATNQAVAAIEADISQASAPTVAVDEGTEQDERKMPQIDFDIGDVDLDGKPLKRGTKPEIWLRHYEQLLAFKIIHGHCRVPCKFNENKKLGSWVKLQREDYKKMKEKKATPMCKYRINLLEKIGFEWRIASEVKTSWEERLEALKAFKNEHGHCDVPQAYPKDVALGKWVSKQRDFYRFLTQGKPTRMTQERVDKLNELGFRWVIGKGKALRTWEDYFKDLVKFKDKYGHTNIPVGFRDSPALGTWAAQQRKNFIKQHNPKIGPRKGMAEKLRRLEEIGFHFHMKEPDKKVLLPQEPRKRGRPKKSTGEVVKQAGNKEQPKKRGRSKKSLGPNEIKAEASESLVGDNMPKKRGRPRKSAPVDEPKKRGRTKKVDTDADKETETPRRGRSRTSLESVDAHSKTEDTPKKRGRAKKLQVEKEESESTKKRCMPKKSESTPQKKKRGRPSKIKVISL